jgi:hypothetical protein
MLTALNPQELHVIGVEGSFATKNRERGNLRVRDRFLVICGFYRKICRPHSFSDALTDMVMIIFSYERTVNI